MRFRMLEPPDAKRPAVGALIACALSFIGTIAGAAPDDPDRGFGDAGVVALSPLKGTAASRIVVDDRGRIVVALQQETLFGPFDPSAVPALTRLLEDGSPDPSFGVAGSVGMRALCGDYCPAHELVARKDGGYVMLSQGRVYWLGERGSLEARGDSGLFYPPAKALAVQPDGAALVAGRIPIDPGFEDGSTAGVVRVLPGGVPDPYFGVAGRVNLGLNVYPTAILALPDGRSLVAWQDFGLTIAALRPNGARDPSFGSGGVYEELGLEALRPLTLYQTQNGSIFVAGWSKVLDRERGTILKLTPDGARDTTFGVDGRVSTHAADIDGLRSEVRRVGVDGLGRLVALVRVNKSRLCGTACEERVYVARWHADGTADAQFAAHGGNFLQSAVEVRGEDLAIDGKGRAVVAGAIEHRPLTNPFVPDRLEPQGQAAVFRVEGGATTLPRTIRESRGYEFLHAAFGHYFVTSGPRESNLLVSAAGPWTLTGRSFKVWSEAGSSVTPVCRFWSDQTFAPKSSHFYTPFTVECDALKAGDVWRFEPDQFYLRLPEGLRGAATCASGSQPLYRAYNNGIGGAPNHRYTTDPVLLDEMIARGWSFEGEARTRVFACVPLQ